MITLCTLSDKKYLAQGLTLFESLLSKTDNFILHYLCLDDETYGILKKIDDVRLKIYHTNDLTSEDLVLSNLRKNEYQYFCWTLASYFTNYLMKQIDEPITYIDSDIFFHHDFNEILNEIGQKHVAIFRHRQFPLSSKRPEGLFNVGVVYFNNSEISKKILEWWSDAVLYKKYKELSTCGDQKYLEAFPTMCNPEDILIDGNIGHGAPWQWHIYDLSQYLKDGTIIWVKNKQKLVFTHFSQFSFDLENNTYVPSKMHHIYTPLSSYVTVPELKMIYDEYFENIKLTHKKYLNG